MVQDKFETGMYIIDQDFKILNVNETMKELYPSVKPGDLCYKAIALQECQCSVCPLLQDNALFYNPLRKEWISANAAMIDYPGCGKCYAVQFHIRQNISEAEQESLQEDNLDEHILELSGGTLDACVIGGYCAPGSPLSYANEQMVSLMGYDSVEEMSRAVDGLVFNTIHPDDVDRVTAELTQCALNGGNFATNYRMHRKNNSWFWVVVRGKRVQTASGAYVLLCVITDMTEFVQRQNELRQENENLLQRGIAAHAAMTHMPNGYHRCGVGEGYPFLFVSRSFEELVGYTAEQLRAELDNKFINLVYPEDMPRFRQLEADIADHGNGDVAYRIRRRDGEIRWVQNSTMTIEWEGVPGYQGTISDITEFVNQQEEFARQRTQFDMVAESVPCGYHRCSVNNGFHLEFVSDSFMETMGYERDELLGKPFLDFVFPEDRELFMQYEPVLASEGNVELVYRILRKDGSIRWIKDSTIRIQYNGKDTYQCILADLTDHVERLNQAIERAEASNQAKSAFLFNASHDIRTPMNAILGFAHIIRENLDDRQLVRESTDKVIQAGNTLMMLMNDILELSRIEQGKDKIKAEPIDLYDHGKNLYEMFSGEMAAAGIQFQAAGDALHDVVLCDHLKLTRIMMNMLSNAKKFTPAGGSVSFGGIRLRSDEKSVAYRFFVRDTGIGMSEEFQKKAFEQFERERSTTASGITGSGLGLAIIKKLVDLMDGEVSIQSKIGEGTEIDAVLTFPRADKDSLENEHKDLSPAELSGKRILLVEDNDFNRGIARYVFEDVGFVIEEAVNGEECLKKLEAATESFDLILMDIQMPVMDGYEATRRIRAHSNLQIAKTPIIAMTANAFEEDKKKCLEVGMDAHIGKPLEPQVVLKEFTRVLSR